MARYPDRHVTRDPLVRRVIVDTGAAASRRHAIPAWFTADVTDVLPRLSAGSGTGSLTTYVVASLARSVAAHPRVHALRDLRGRIVTFDAVDVNVVVEVTVDGQSFPLNHVLRSVQHRSVADLHRELRRVKVSPSSSETLRLAGAARWFLHLPGPVRSRVIGALHRLPDLQRQLVGTVGVTSVGMHARGSGLGLPFLVHTLDVLVGGLEGQPGLDERGALVSRNMLHIAVLADHDVVDGAPLTRFLADFRANLQSGAALTLDDRAAR